MYKPTQSQVERLCQNAMKSNDRIKSCVARYLACYYSTKDIAEMLDQTEDNIMLYMGMHYNWFIVEYTPEKSLIIKDIGYNRIVAIIAEEEVCLVQ